MNAFFFVNHFTLTAKICIIPVKNGSEECSQRKRDDTGDKHITQTYFLSLMSYIYIKFICEMKKCLTHTLLIISKMCSHTIHEEKKTHDV